MKDYIAAFKLADKRILLLYITAFKLADKRILLYNRYIAASAEQKKKYIHMLYLFIFSPILYLFYLHYL